MDVFLRSEFVPASSAAVPVGDLSVQRGYGIFDFFRVQDGGLLYVEDHVDRFLHSAELMHLPTRFGREELLAILGELKRRNGLKNAGIKMLLTGGPSPDGWKIGEPTLIILHQELNLEIPLIPKAVRVITHDHVRDVPEAKTINYTMGIWLQKRMMELQADDVLYHHHGRVSELPRCNFFIVNSEGVVVTPHTGVLGGITRKRLLEISGVHVGPVTLHDVKYAREAFLTSSTKRIQSIVSVDGQAVGDGKPGPVAKALLSELLDREREYLSR